MLDPEGTVEPKVNSPFPKVLLIPLAMLIVLGALLLVAFPASEQKEDDFYSFKVVNIRGKLVSLEKYRGSVSLVVNVASECGYTDSHYKGLQQLQRDFGPYHFNVLAFPCNQFGLQEPGNNKEIDNFARKTYGASFPMFSKIAVKGTGANPAFKYLIGCIYMLNLMELLGVVSKFASSRAASSLCSQSPEKPICEPESTGEEPTWNFWKYLVDPNGKVLKVWDSTVPVEEVKPYIAEQVRNIILKKKDEL